MILELEVQFQLVIVSIIFSMIVTNIYTFIEILLQKIKLVKNLITLSFFPFVTGVYYLIIYKISEGILSIYLVASLVLGYVLHMRFYDKYFSCLYNYLFLKISSIINNVKGRCKKSWKEHSLKKMRRKRKSTEQFLM